MKGINNHHFAQEEHVSLPDWFIRRVLGDPKRGPVAVVNAQTAAAGVEQDREDFAQPREQRLVELLRLSLPYVLDSNQGRGDKGLEKMIREEIRRG